MPVPKDKEKEKEPTKFNSGLGEAMGGLIILLLLLPFAALTLKATTEIVRAECRPGVDNGR